MISMLFVIPTLRGGGAERVFTMLANSLDKSKFNITFLVLDISGSVFDKGLPSCVKVIPLNIARVRLAFPALIYHIRQIKPDIVFSTLWYLNLALVILRPIFPKKFCHVARETSIVSQRITVESQSKIWYMMYRLLYRFVPNIVCQSYAMQTDLVVNFGIPIKNTCVINNPVDIEFINAKSHEACPFFHRPDISKKVVLIAAGRLSRAKGFDILLNSIALLNINDLHLVIAGDGPLLSDLKEQTYTLGLDSMVSFVGFQENLYAWLSKAQAFILSSRYEGFPNVVVESLACGTPVIATPAPGGIKEILEGVEGCFIADKITAESLASVIGSWYSSARVRVDQSSVSKFAIEGVTNMYSELFEKIVT